MMEVNKPSEGERLHESWDNWTGISKSVFWAHEAEANGKCVFTRKLGRSLRHQVYMDG